MSTSRQLEEAGLLGALEPVISSLWRVYINCTPLGGSPDSSTRDVLRLLTVYR